MKFGPLLVIGLSKIQRQSLYFLILIILYDIFCILEIYQEVPAVAEGGAGQAGRGSQGQGDCP